MRWDDLQLLLALERAGTLAGAALEVDLDATTVSRRLAALERELGAQLVVKARGSVAFTKAAAGVLEEARLVERAVERAQRRAKGEHQEVRGVVRLTSSEQLASRVLAPALPGLLTRHPQLQVDLRVSSGAEDLLRREVDVALRIAEPRGEGLRVRRAGELVFGFYRGRLPTPGPGRSLLSYSTSMEAKHERGIRRAVAAGGRVPLLSTSPAVLAAAARAGLGTAILPCLTGDADPGLLKVDLGQTIRRTVWVVVHRDQAKVARVRAVSDWLVNICRHQRAALRGEGPLKPPPR